ncbi:hypothetical protein [Profundibacter sp.]
MLLRPLICATLTGYLLMGSVALAEPERVASIKFSCLLSNASKENVQLNVAIDSKDQIQFSINGAAANATFLPNIVNHSPTIAFAASHFSNVYTLVIHRKFFRPYPEGYDSSAPPASLTVQHSDAQLVPVVDVYLGKCLVE